MLILYYHTFPSISSSYFQMFNLIVYFIGGCSEFTGRGCHKVGYHMVQSKLKISCGIASSNDNHFLNADLWPYIWHMANIVQKETTYQGPLPRVDNKKYGLGGSLYSFLNYSNWTKLLLNFPFFPLFLGSNPRSYLSNPSPVPLGPTKC